MVIVRIRFHTVSIVSDQRIYATLGRGSTNLKSRLGWQRGRNLPVERRHNYLSGELFVLPLVDEDGYFYFIDRLKDCIRRYGENISAFEVEAILADFPGVEDCAVIAVPSRVQGSEDEVMAVIAASDRIRPDELATYCRKNLPKFSVPSYIRFVTAGNMPRTATNKIMKAKLREIGITADTYVVQ